MTTDILTHTEAGVLTIALKPSAAVVIRLNRRLNAPYVR